MSYELRALDLVHCEGVMASQGNRTSFLSMSPVILVIQSVMYCLFYVNVLPCHHSGIMLLRSEICRK